MFYCLHVKISSNVMFAWLCVFSFSVDEGVYNTYIIDTDYREWALVMHCAEKPKSNRYLSALMLSRTPTIGINVINFLRFECFNPSSIFSHMQNFILIFQFRYIFREKLPQYDIDVSFMFPINQENCEKIIVKNQTDAVWIKKSWKNKIIVKIYGIACMYYNL